LFPERKGDDKDSGGQGGDDATTDAQCVKYMAEENEQATQPALPPNRTPGTCCHGMLQTMKKVYVIFAVKVTLWFLHGCQLGFNYYIS